MGLQRTFACTGSSRLPTVFAVSVGLVVSSALAGTNLPAEKAGQGLYDPSAKTEMETFVSAGDAATFAAGLPTDWMLFVEDRTHSIRNAAGLPARWLDNLPAHTGAFSGTAQPGEFYVFQLGVFAAKAATGPVSVQYENLPGVRCISLGGTDFLGRPFTKTVSVEKGRLQALWFGVEVPKNAVEPLQGRVIVTASGASQAVEVTLNIAGPVLEDQGDRDSWRLSRLRWLDSTLGLDDDVVTQPFLPLVRSANTLKMLGRELVLDEAGLPQQLRSFFNDDNTAILPEAARTILASPFRFVVETSAGPVDFGPASLQYTRELKGAVNWHAVSQAPGMELTVDGLLEYDGFGDFRCQLRSAQPVTLQDIRLEFAVAPGADAYFMGLGRKGGKAPDSVDWKWDSKVNQDGWWMGAVNGGFKLQLYGANWRTPLINCYYHFRELLLPESWGTGGIRLAKSADGTKAVAYSGPRELVPDQPLDFNFRLFLTPFKPLNTEEQWSLRYLHKTQDVSDKDYRDLRRVAEMGANVINIHHNKEQNPTINYPYFDLSLPLLKQCVTDAHRNGVKTKIYYTTREITNNLPELFAFWSLNGEIICPSPGMDGAKARPVTNPDGPHPWLAAHLGDTGYIPAWRETIGGRYRNMPDLAVITTPDSRLDNFYCEGLAFTLRETGFDGLYIDDTALGRKGFQRAHRIFEQAGKPLLADMHSWNHNNDLAGNAASAYVFLQNFPYYHRLWYGEGHDCNLPPDEMLVQQSGIPFGLMSEMLDRPNPWHGMVFGETARLNWSGDPRPLWKFWDSFGMAGTVMSGWWNPACPVRTDHPQVPATVYRKPGKALIALASWATDKVAVRLTVDWKALGLDAQRATLRAPAIADYQTDAVYAADAPIPVEPGKGWLLVAEETAR